MQRKSIVAAVALIASLGTASLEQAKAACTLPYTLTNGTVADATQVMANLNALAACVSGPAGSNNSLQYNGGSGSFGGVGPLTNGQLLIGSTGNAPQAATLTAGSGIAITNGAGSISIATTGSGGGTGLFNQILSSTPTKSGTGFTTWINQGSSSENDGATGIYLSVPQIGNHFSGLSKTAPATPYQAVFLVIPGFGVATEDMITVGWYDGSNKLDTFGIYGGGAGYNSIWHYTFSTPTSLNSNTQIDGGRGLAGGLWWLRLGNDGTNITFDVSNDGANWTNLYSVAVGSGYLSSYANIIIGMVNYNGAWSYTLASYGD